MKAYSISARKKHTECDLTIEITGCDLRCRYCCTAYGRRLPSRYYGMDEIYKRICQVYLRSKPDIIRFTGGEFSLTGSKGIELYCKMATELTSNILIESHAMHISFFKRFARVVRETGVRSPFFLFSVKDERHVISGNYRTMEVVENIRKIRELFPFSYMAHGMIAFEDDFRNVLFRLFPEVAAHEKDIKLERSGRFKFESVSAPDLQGRFFYYFHQKVKKYRVGKRS